MLLGTLGTSLLGNLLTGKGVNTAIPGWGVIWTGFLMLPHPLTNFEIQKYYQKEPTFNGVYFRNNLPKVKNQT